MRFLFRVLLLFLVVSTVLSIIRGAFRVSQPPRGVPNPEPHGSDRAVSGHLVKDPVCGTYVAESTAIRVRDAFFCSEECRQKYLAGTV
jgi:hypothetical protein